LKIEVWKKPARHPIPKMLMLRKFDVGSWRGKLGVGKKLAPFPKM